MQARRHDSTTARQQESPIKPSTINHQPSTINPSNHQPSIIKHQTSNIKQAFPLPSLGARGSGRHFHVI